MNILLIDSKVKDYETVVNSCNSNTFPIVYSYDSTRDEINNLISNINQKINRIGIFADENATLFLDNEPFLDNIDNLMNDNTTFIISIINGYDISYIDYFACNTLIIQKWVNYYNKIMSLTNVIVGASNNKTGNIQYGGDWIMENTCQDIEYIYFTQNIEYYKYLLVLVYGGSKFFVGTSSNSELTKLFIQGTGLTSAQATGDITSTGFYFDNTDIINTIQTTGLQDPGSAFTRTGFYYDKKDGNGYIDIGRYFNQIPIASDPTVFINSDSTIFTTTGNNYMKYIYPNNGIAYFINYSGATTNYPITLTVSKDCSCTIVCVGGGSVGSAYINTFNSGGSGGGIVSGNIKALKNSTYNITIASPTIGNNTASGLGNTRNVNGYGNTTTFISNTNANDVSITAAGGSRVSNTNGNSTRIEFNSFTSIFVNNSTINYTYGGNGGNILRPNGYDGHTMTQTSYGKMYNAIYNSGFPPGVGFCGGGKGSSTINQGMASGNGAIGGTTTYPYAYGQNGAYGCGGGASKNTTTTSTNKGGDGGAGFIYLYIDTQL